MVKIIVEKHDGHWSAWIDVVPEVAFGGEWPSQAIEKLIDHFGREKFDIENMAAIDAQTTIAHQVFRIPIGRLRVIPVPSLN